TRADVHRDDEVGQLARSFNSMLDRLDGARSELEELNRNLELRVDERARALHESEKRYRQLFDRNLAGVYIATLQGHVLACNEAFARMLGYESTEQFLAEGGMIAYVRPQEREELIERLRNEEAVTNEESELRGRDGKSVWALENVRLAVGPDHEATLEGILLDVTDRKRAE